MLCRMLEIIQIDDANLDSLIVSTFANMNWLGDKKQHERLVVWHAVLTSLKNKVVINDRMEMCLLFVGVLNCFKQSGRHSNALKHG